MILEFRVSEDDLLAFNERYLELSKKHHRTFLRLRWVVPLVMMGLVLVHCSHGRVTVAAFLPYVVVGVLWYGYFPTCYSASTRDHLKQQLARKSNLKMVGVYVLAMDETGMDSSSPLGVARYQWSELERVVVTDTHLVVFLKGLMGYPIAKAELGPDLFEEARKEFERRLTEQQLLKAPKWGRTWG